MSHNRDKKKGEELTYQGFTGYENFSSGPNLERRQREVKPPTHSQSTFRDKVRNVYNAPQRFLEEETKRLDENEEGDVFDNYRTRTIRDRENDYQQQWRNRAKFDLSPERHDPFAPKKKNQSSKKKGKKNKPVERRRYKEVMREVELEREKKHLEREFDKVVKEKKRKRYVEKQYRKDNPDERSRKRRKRESPERRDRKYRSGRDERHEDSRRPRYSRDSRAPREERRRYGRNDRRDDRRGSAQGRDHSFRGERKKKYEWGEAEEEEEDQGPKEQPSFMPSGNLRKDVEKQAKKADSKGLMKWKCPPEASLPTQKWRIYLYENNKEMKDENPMKLYNGKFFLFGNHPRKCDVIMEKIKSIDEEHAVLCFRRKKVKKGEGQYEFDDEKVEVIVPYLMDLESKSGTFLNGQRIQQARYYEILHADEVRFGKSNKMYLFIHEDKLKK